MVDTEIPRREILSNTKEIVIPIDVVRTVARGCTQIVEQLVDPKQSPDSLIFLLRSAAIYKETVLKVAQTKEITLPAQMDAHIGSNFARRFMKETGIRLPDEEDMYFGNRRRGKSKEEKAFEKWLLTDKLAKLEAEKLRNEGNSKKPMIVDDMAYTSQTAIAAKRIVSQAYGLKPNDVSYRTVCGFRRVSPTADIVTATFTEFGNDEKLFLEEAMIGYVRNENDAQRITTEKDLQRLEEELVRKENIKKGALSVLEQKIGIENLIGLHDRTSSAIATSVSKLIS
jgi:hypothetical protein